MSPRPRLQVLHTRPEDRTPIREKEGRRPPACWHTNFLVDPNARTVICDDCQTVVDPYQALHQLAQDINRYHVVGERARREAERAERELEDVQRLIRNAKSRARTALRDVADCEGCPGRVVSGWVWCPRCGGRLPKA